MREILSKYFNPKNNPANARKLESFFIESYLMMMDDIDQHPLMCHLLSSATQQMHGQQSFSIETKYFKQSRSAGISAPFSWAAFSQMG